MAGSYPERAGDAVYHTVALASPAGEIVARYRATHLGADSAWAKAGDAFVVAPTAIGRIALALGEELAVPEVFGVYSAERADIVAAPAGAWRGPVGRNRSEALQHAASARHAVYAVCSREARPVLGGGSRMGSAREAGRVAARTGTGDRNAPARCAGLGERLEVEVAAPWSGTWINQDQLIDGQQPWNTLPLVLAKDSACLAAWGKAAGWKSACW